MMKLSYRQIHYLREVARHSSITQACKKLHISQSPVLAAIDLAEEITRTQLFIRRKGHGVELTPAGQQFMLSVKRFVAAGNEFDRSLDQFSQPITHTLRIGCFSPFGPLIIPPVLKRYREDYGECEIILMEGDQIALRNWMLTGSVDLVVTYDIGEEFGNHITPICKISPHALLRKDDPLAQKNVVSMRELADRPLILLNLPETRTYLMALFDFAAQRPKISLKTRSYETIRSAVVSGLGISVLNIRPSSHSSPDNEELIRLPIADKLKAPTLMVADPYGPQKPRYVTAFIHTLYQYFCDIGPEGFSVTQPEYTKELLYPRPELDG